MDATDDTQQTKTALSQASRWAVTERPPVKTEIEFFNRSGVPGYAAQDDRVVLNPSPGAGVNMDAVRTNEALRILMRKEDLPRPTFSLTNEQMKRFSGYGSEQDIRETIAARIATGDPSVPGPTMEQKSFAKQLLGRFNAK